LEVYCQFVEFCTDSSSVLQGNAFGEGAVSVSIHRQPDRHDRMQKQRKQSKSTERTAADVHRVLSQSLARVQYELLSVTAILVELAESYQAIVDECPAPPVELPVVSMSVVGRFFGFAGTVLSYGQLEMVVQEALAAYESHVLRPRRSKTTPPDCVVWAAGDQPDEDLAVTGGNRTDRRIDGDDSHWAAMISSIVEGRLRRHGSDRVTMTTNDDVDLRSSYTGTQTSIHIGL